MANFGETDGQTDFGQSDFGQLFDRLWPNLGLTDFGEIPACSAGDAGETS